MDSAFPGPLWTERMPVRFIHRGAWSDTIEARAMNGAASAVKVAEAGGELRSHAERWASAARELGALVNHPHVSTYRSIDLVDGWLSAEREYVEGVDVGTAVTSTGPAPLEVAAEITRAVVAGIRAVHGAGFVAGRASPSHVLVGRDGRTLLLHAGLPDVGAHSPRDRANQVDREVAFAPPERFAGSANDARSDVFSAASLMLLLVAGRPVIPRGHRLARVLARRGVHVVPDGEALPDVDGALGAILSLALRAEPEARPGIDALEEALASRAASADEVAGWTRAVLGNAALGDGRA